jgi:hypothetical protein
MASRAPPPISVPATAFATALSAAACPALLTPNLLRVLLPREADGTDPVEALIRSGQEHDARNIAVSEAIGSDAFHSRGLAGAYLEGGVGEPSGTTLSQPLAQVWTCG